VEDDLLPERLVEARHDVDLNVQLAEEPNRLEGLVVSIVREREDHPVDASFAYEARQVVGASEDLQLLQIAPLVLRPRVDEPDQPHAVFGMLEELSADHLADRSCADDDGVLDIGREPTGEGTRAAPRQRHRHDREQPERRKLLLIRVGEAGHPGEREEPPGADRDKMEHAGDLVDRRVVGPLVVVVVEPVELRPDHPDRERAGEDEGLEARPDTRDQPGLARESKLGRAERDAQPDHIGDREHSANEPPAPVFAPCARGALRTGKTAGKLRQDASGETHACRALGARLNGPPAAETGVQRAPVSTAAASRPIVPLTLPNSRCKT